MKFYYILLLLFMGCNELLAQYRPPLFFREDWKEIPAQLPVTQEHVNNPDLLMTLYGPGGDSLKKSHHEQPVDDPYYIWSGRCRGNWAITLKDTDQLVDLSNYAKVKWRSKQAGLRHLRIILKLEDGTWLVSDQSDGPSSDWRIREFNLADINWHRLNIDEVTEGSIVPEPDLSRVAEIGWTDLMTGGNSAACSRLDWIEVYGFPVE
ncbi:MAG: hypothetical protein ACNS62_02710 [Candidatus Cyclobacteriaceae bacterium M3_2C_046]